MNHTNLVSVEELAAHMNDPQWVVLDCRFDLAKPDAGRQAYTISHVPGAHYADLNRALSSPITAATGRHPLPDSTILAQQFGAWGIGPNTQVVAYDDSGGPFAARAWWLLRWLGHTSVAVLDGGWKAWRAQDRTVTTDVPTARPTAFAGRPQTMWLTTAQLIEAQRDSSRCLIDVRAAERYAGDVEPIDPVAGHVPGARNIPFAQNLAANGHFKSADELRRVYTQQLGDVDPRKLIVMCGSGVTACHTLLALDVAGWQGAQLYAGSWSEWIRDPSRPVTRGANP